MAIGSCAVLGAAVGAFDYGGKNLAGAGGATQEEKRRNFFKNPDPLAPKTPNNITTE
jgi:hypothetical protein